MKKEKNPKKLAKKSKKSPKNPKILKKSKKVKKFPENPNFFPFSDLNLRTPKCGVVNPSPVIIWTFWSMLHELLLMDRWAKRRRRERLLSSAKDCHPA